MAEREPQNRLTTRSKDLLIKTNIACIGISTGAAGIFFAEGHPIAGAINLAIGGLNGVAAIGQSNERGREIDRLEAENQTLKDIIR